MSNNQLSYTGDGGGSSESTSNASTGAGYVGDFLSVFGNLMSSQAQQYVQASNTEAYDFNANAADQNARQSIALSAQQERQQRIIGRKAVGDMRANFGASGFTMEGSATNVLAESMAAVEMDALNIRYAGQVKAINYSNQATQFRSQARSSRRAQSRSSAGGLLGILGGVAGAVIGGPGGAAVGYQVGNSLGQNVG